MLFIYSCKIYCTQPVVEVSTVENALFFGRFRLSVQHNTITTAREGGASILIRGNAPETNNAQQWLRQSSVRTALAFT
jgi:hypothetical protein